MTQTRSQRLAQQIYRQIAPVQHRDTEFRKQYGRLCNRFPTLVLENGLAQATGFLAGKAGAKNDTVEAFFLGHLKAVLLGDSEDNLLERIIAADLPHYQHLTRTALAAAGWYRRYAQGLLGIDATGESAD